MKRALYFLYLLFRWTSEETCLEGKCWCRSATDCRFARCRNCDSLIDSAGKTVEDHSCEEWDSCPDCGGPFNEHRRYGWNGERARRA